MSLNCREFYTQITKVTAILWVLFDNGCLKCVLTARPFDSILNVVKFENFQTLENRILMICHKCMCACVRSIALIELYNYRRYRLDIWLFAANSVTNARYRAKTIKCITYYYGEGGSVLYIFDIEHTFICLWW